LGCGFLVLLLGIMLIFRAIFFSSSPGFSTIGFGNSVRLVYGGALSIMTGGQIVLTSFVLSILGLNPK
jgi:hypothetical protein